MNNSKLLFDGDCLLCQKLSKVVLYLKNDALLCVEPFQSHLEDNQEIPYHELNQEIHFLGPQDIYKGHHALIELTRHLKFVKYLYPVLRLYPISKVIQFIYFLLKKYRKKSKACKAK
ncbi:MAG: DUF393 domain-containing protein [Candidatus Cloacimonetes bacterium]|nr:DUF393 domain-containing protein [Candidatus Cloacimonadota bacterium]